MYSSVTSSVVCGIEGHVINVETDINPGLPNTSIVGLASTVVMESRERIRSALINSGFEYPHGRVTINLVPADLKKAGSCLDLPISISLLASDGKINPDKCREYAMIGELSLDGHVNGVDGILPMIISLANQGYKKIIISADNEEEARFVLSNYKDIQIFSVKTIKNTVDIIHGEKLALAYNLLKKGRSSEDISCANDEINGEKLDFSDIKGQQRAKRVITIAVAGRHGILMIGNPGCGKSMIAKRIPTIMPSMTAEEIIETAIICSVNGLNRSDGIKSDRPFRSPHHSIGKAGLIGGGNDPLPGEISMAHNGVLFLDEICEFESEKIESLRQPIEERSIVHFRRGRAYKFPCDFQLVMASNPCKCGYYGDPNKACKCTQYQIESYQKKLSGPIMDRIDMKVIMQPVSYDDLNGNGDGISSKSMKDMIMKSIDFRMSKGRLKYNSAIEDSEIFEVCQMSSGAKIISNKAYSSLGLSPRMYKRVLKVARTIADIDESDLIEEEHISEALGYRL